MSGLNGSLTITAANSTRSLKSEDFPLTVSFTPSELGLVGVPANKLPKSIKVPAKKVEEKVFRQFGLSEAQVKSRLQTENEPFKAIKTGENDEGAWASFNPQTGKYVVSLRMTKSLHRDLTNRANQIKTESRAADQTTQNTAKPNENFDGRDGINQTDFQRAKLEKLLRDAEILPTSFGLPTNLSDLNHVVVTIPPNVSPTADSALSAYIEKRFGSGNLSGQDKLDILSSARQNGVKVENLKISPNNSRVAEFDLSIESLLKLQKSYLDVQYKVNKDVAIADKIKHEMALNQFLLGAMQGAWDDVKGTYNTVTSPLQTIQQIREAVGILSQLSTEDLKNIITELGSKAINATPGEAAYGAGYVVGTLAIEIIAGKGAGAALSALSKTKAGAAFLAKLGKVAEKTGEIANLGKLKIAEIFSDEAAMLASQRIKYSLSNPTFYSGFAGSNLIGDFVIFAGNKLKNGAISFKEFIDLSVKEYGSNIKNKVDELAEGYRQAMKQAGLSNDIVELEIEKTKKLAKYQFQKESDGAKKKLLSGIAEAENQGVLQKIKSRNINDYDWLTQNPRHKELAFDPDTKEFKIDEAKAILEAEKQGVIKSPVKRGIFDDGSTRGADYIDANGIEWDIKKASGGAGKIIETLQGGENVVVDARGMREEDFRLMKADIEAKRPRNNNQVRYVR